MNTKHVPIGISNRHVHLDEETIYKLFGKYELTPMKELSQPGQFAAKEVVDVLGSGNIPGDGTLRRQLKKVRILGPARQDNQVELSMTDARQLGIRDVPIRLSGVLNNTPGIILSGPKGQVMIPEGVIIAQRHIHIEPWRAKEWGLNQGDVVSIGFPDDARGGIITNVIVRISGEAALDLHIDTDEGNSFNIKTGDEGVLLKKDEVFDYMVQNKIII